MDYEVLQKHGGVVFVKDNKLYIRNGGRNGDIIRIRCAMNNCPCRGKIMEERLILTVSVRFAVFDEGVKGV